VVPLALLEEKKGIMILKSIMKTITLFVKPPLSTNPSVDIFDI